MTFRENFLGGVDASYALITLVKLVTNRMLTLLAESLNPSYRTSQVKIMIMVKLQECNCNYPCLVRGSFKYPTKPFFGGNNSDQLFNKYLDLENYKSENNKHSNIEMEPFGNKNKASTTLRRRCQQNILTQQLDFERLPQHRLKTKSISPTFHC